jgi:hypothetical protein
MDLAIMKRISKKQRQREQLILALLEQPGLEKAAASIGISSVTAWRISKTPEFDQEYRQARHQVFSQAMARLQNAARPAVSTLLKAMLDKDASASTRVRAADSVLQHAADSFEREDLHVRLLRLEQMKGRRE